MQFLTTTDMAKSYERMVNETNGLAGWRIDRSKAFVEFKGAFGADSVGFLLGEMGSRPNAAALAMLEQVTGENPVPENLRGNVSEAAKAWIKWGLRNKGRV